MLLPFLSLAMRAPNRQRAFRTAVGTHVVTCAMATAAVLWSPVLLPMVGQLALVVGIVEGAILLGWRLTQMPKSQALEFLLVSPVQPRRLFMLEAAAGLGRLALITLSGLPVLGMLVATGSIELTDLAVLLAVPLTWAAITGIGLTTWAYEPRSVRRWGEVLCIGGIICYLLVGVLVGEKLSAWVTWLPAGGQYVVMEGFRAFHTWNPFGVMQYWFEPHHPSEIMWERMIGLEALALLGLVMLLGRAAFRLKGHFHDRHYRPLTEVTPDTTGGVGDRPLAWWAVRRVLEYSGQVNLWLAGGFGLVYAAYTVAGDRWPPWLGRLVFQMVESVGGIPVVATGLTLLAAVPAAFQYGLWDSTTQERCRRLELLLLTHLTGRDYYDAAAAAAWRRGRGYFAIAGVLWLAAYIAGRATATQAAGAAAAAVTLWGCYFALGFRAFSRGAQANGLGSLLTLGLPFGTLALTRCGFAGLGALTPPGAVFAALSQGPSLAWLGGPVAMGLGALTLGRIAVSGCDRDLRAWYEVNHGSRAVD